MEDMTHGKPLRLLIRFTVPLLLGNLFQQLYGLVDAIIIGRSLGMNAIGAIGAVGSLTAFVQGFIFGIGSGLSLILAQRFGAKNEERIKSSFHTSIQISIIGVLTVSLISIFFSDIWLRFMNIPTNLYDDSRAYFITAMTGLAVLLYFNLMCNVLRSQGDTRKLLGFTVLSQLLNIMFDILFIMVFQWGVSGVALATILSQFIVGILCHRSIVRRFPIFRMVRSDWRMDKRELLLHSKISIPIGVQSAIISIGSIVLQSQLNRLGSSAVEGHAIAARLEGMVTAPMFTMGVAVSTYVAQNYGANRIDRIWQGIRTSLLLSTGYSFIMGTLIFFRGTLLVEWMFGATEQETLANVDYYFKMTALFYFLLAILFVLRSSIQGMGRSVAPTLSGLVEMTIRSIVPLSLVGSLGFTAIVISHPLSWFSTALIMGVAIYFILRNDRKESLFTILTK